MKLAARPAQPTRRRTRGSPRQSPAPREYVALHDLTDCLLRAYEFIAQRAYEKFLLRGGEPGRELEDWLDAERELLLPIVVNIEESEDFVRALAATPGFSGAEIGVGIEPRWLAIIACHETDDQPEPSQVFSIHQLPAEVDPARATVIFSNGLLGIRMAKTKKVGA
jgi:HSP20 family molecular chaperone IbpA